MRPLEKGVTASRPRRSERLARGHNGRRDRAGFASGDGVEDAARDEWSNCRQMVVHCSACLSRRELALTRPACLAACERLAMPLDPSRISPLNPETAPAVYQKVGPRSMDALVQRNLRAAIRESTASHTANALYTGEREMVAKQIYDQLVQKIGGRGITVESVLLRDIQLPASLKSSIESKQQAEQEALAMNFRLQKEKQEAERKRIEAAGIRDFQQIVAQGISPALLEWKGIEATETLAKSSNSKVVVIGNSKHGLPLILGQ